ncbi:MAG TPA: glycosyltransferase family 4 protein [Methylomirabilota bacterium]|jgi:glycosyltransferase involved in cell wall biosynthesis
MKRVSVLFALTQPVRGGVEEVVLALARRLDPTEFRLALAAPAPLLEAFAPDLTGVAIETEAVEAESWRRRDQIARLSAFIARFKPDIVNAHLFRSTAVAAPLARWHGARVVETYHGREGWRRGLLGGSFLPDRLVSRLVDRVIAVSEAARAFLISGKGYDPRKIVVVPNGRDLSVFRPGAGGQAVRKELGIDRATPLIGVIGRLEEQKGHVYILEAWPSVLAEFPDARLLLVGDGSLRAALERRAQDLGVTGSVLFAGFRSDVPRVLDALDVLALPSLYEGMPLTAIEASAMAKPVVATAVDGTPEVVRDGRTGRLVPPRDVVALSRALRSVLRDPAAAKRLGSAGRDLVFNRFDLTRQVDATARVYRETASVLPQRVAA